MIDKQKLATANLKKTTLHTSNQTVFKVSRGAAPTTRLPEHLQPNEITPWDSPLAPSSPSRHPSRSFFIQKRDAVRLLTEAAPRMCWRFVSSTACNLYQHLKRGRSFYMDSMIPFCKSSSSILHFACSKNISIMTSSIGHVVASSRRTLLFSPIFLTAII